MKLAMLALTLIIVLAVGIMAGSTYFNNRSPSIAAQNGQSLDYRPPLAEKSAEDLTYSQEVRTFTAQTRQLQDQLREQREAAASSAREQNERIQKLQKELEDARKEIEGKRGKEVADLMTENSKLKADNDQIRSDMETLKTTLEDIKSNPATANTDDIAALVAAEVAKIKGEVPVEPALVNEQPTDAVRPPSLDNVFIPGAGSATTQTQGEVAVAPAEKPARIHHRPYGMATSGGQQEGNGDFIDHMVDNVSNVFTRGQGAKTAGTDTGNSNPISTVTSNIRATAQASKFPVYTLPVTSMLNDAVLVTPMIGKVPMGNNVNDPYRFQLELGATNLAANGHRIPGVSKVLAAGTAIGNRDQSCVRGNIHTLTFIFIDGRIQTVSSGENTSPTTGGLAYIADPWGKPCIRGEYINNGVDYLKSRSGAAFLQGLAAAYGDSQITRQTDSNGFRDVFVSGNTYQYAAAHGLASTANEIANYVRERSLDAFDVVYVPQASKVQLIVEKQIEIDYDTSARKVSYLKADSKVTYD